MSRKQPASVEEFRLANTFEMARKRLLEEPQFAESLKRPLAFWALSTDRRLPRVFLGRPLGELIETPFAELMSTPGIGHRKIASLVTLLQRALADPAPDPATVGPPPSENGHGELKPGDVSEAMWVQWRESVKQHGQQHEKLGRLAPTLQALPTVIWNTPLSYYVDRTLAEIRRMKTHGEKRVRVVLEVFSIVHSALAQCPPQSHLDVQLVPDFARPLEEWARGVLRSETPPTVDEVRRSLAEPLVAQVEIDLGPQVAGLAAERLGLTGEAHNVRDQARELGVTRARIYQLLDDCAKVSRVRWHEGEWLLRALVARSEATATDAEAQRMIAAVADLFYPHSGEVEKTSPVEFAAVNARREEEETQQAIDTGEAADGAAAHQEAVHQEAVHQEGVRHDAVRQDAAQQPAPPSGPIAAK